MTGARDTVCTPVISKHSEIPPEGRQVGHKARARRPVCHRRWAAASGGAGPVPAAEGGTPSCAASFSIQLPLPRGSQATGAPCPMGSGAQPATSKTTRSVRTACAPPVRTGYGNVGRQWSQQLPRNGLRATAATCRLPHITAQTMSRYKIDLRWRSKSSSTGCGNLGCTTEKPGHRPTKRLREHLPFPEKSPARQPRDCCCGGITLTASV